MSGLRFLVLLGAALLLGSTTYAGKVETIDGKTIISVKSFWLPNANNPSVDEQANVETMRQFLKEFPSIFKERYAAKYKAEPGKYGNFNWDNVEIRLVPFSGIKVEGVESDLLAIAGGIAPDIVYVNFRKSDNYIMNSFLHPMDEYYAQLTDEERDFRVHPKLWQVIQRKGPRGKKHIWALPYGGALGRVLLYRKDFFDRAGIPYPTAKWTWEDLYDACKKMTDPGKGTYGISLGRGKHESWFWMSFLWSAGGEAMVYDEESDTWSCAFDSEGAVLALDFYNQLSNERWTDDEGKTRRGYAMKSGERADKWQRGEIAMRFDYVDERMFSSIDPEVTGMAPVPLGPEIPDGKGGTHRIRGAELNSRMVGLYSGIKSPVVRDAAWEYMRFMTSPKAIEIRTRRLVEGGLGHFVNPKYLKQFGYEELIRLSPRGWAKTFEIAISTGKPEPFGTNSNVAYDMMTYPIHEAEALSLNDQLPESVDERRKVLAGLLETHCARANEVMIGKITPMERLKRRIVAGFVLVAIVITFGLVFRKIIQAFTPTNAATGEKKGWQFKRYFWAYILMVPALLTILVWRYVPLFRGSVMAFYDYRLLGESAFVWIDNFANLLFDSDWWHSVYNALRYSLLVLALTFLPPIILAILLQEVPKCKILFRTIYYLPAVITGVVVALLWKQFYEPSEKGALNALVLKIPAIGFVILGLILLAVCIAFARRLWIHEINLPGWGFVAVGLLLLGACLTFASPMLINTGESLLTALKHFPTRLFNRPAEAYRWLQDPDTAMLACIIPMVWAGMGPGCLIYLAALKGIPEDYYEAADMDGANFIDKILFVVFPMMKSLIIINFVGAFIGSWYSATGNIMVMTGGGANTETAGLHIWYKAFTYLQFGPATAMAWMLGFLLIGFTVNQLRILSRVEFRAQGSK